MLIGDHKGEVVDALIEGVNILRAQGIISIEVVTYTQSREFGKLTTLELVLPHRLNAHVDLSGVDDGIPENPAAQPLTPTPAVPPPEDPIAPTLEPPTIH